MIINVDLHIHSRFSGGTSKDMNVENILKYGRLKGLNIIGTGDCTHPTYLEEIKQYKDRELILTTEIEDKNRVHHLILLPSISKVEELREILKKYSKDIDKEGRPRVHINGAELLEIVRNVNGLIGPAHCVPPDTLLILENGFKRIVDIKVGEKVLTHENRFKKVEKVYKRRYIGDIIKIKVRYFPEEIILTPEHPVYAIKTEKRCDGSHGICKFNCLTQYTNPSCKKKYRKYKRKWIMAKDLKVGDVIVYPIPKKVKDIKYLSLDKYLNNIKQKSWRNRIPEKIEVSEDFCRLIGYFLSEGYCFRDGIGFALGENEKKIIDDIEYLMKKIFNLKPKIRNDERREEIELKYYSRVLRDFFGDMFYCGDEKRAWNKALPNEFLYLPVSKQLQIFIGWWRGDKGVTTSEILMNQLRLISLRLGFIITFSKHVPKNPKIGDREVIKCHARWQGRISPLNENILDALRDEDIKLPKRDVRYGWIEGNYLYAPIIRIEREYYDGYVYNLEIEDDSSYVTVSGTLHNCFTPWTSLYKSFDSIYDCYNKKPDFVELGLSADTDMADMVPELRDLPFLSNSDAHSYHPHRLGREFNQIEVDYIGGVEDNFEQIKKAIKHNKIIANYGLDPKLGKYHLTACSKCHTRFKLEDAKKYNWKCPKCGGRIKKGVLSRVEELSDGKIEHPKFRPPYYKLIPLAEMISLTIGKGIFTKAVQGLWEEFIKKYGNEIEVLINADIQELAKIHPKVAETINLFRKGKIYIYPGGGGEYGRISFKPQKVEWYREEITLDRWLKQ
ncbi:Hedgehog/intein hint domain protein [Methanocaldococcus vulcanius M7]|uniref:Hedgehog/intein hint domain protein n=2 Tax=Methanocaldococcus TaxID=196118 RepID=C9RF21_METVM|nr:Hedgehog/intein hint domain protein [Methanocaldococcus vulcanius M7]